MLILAVRSHMNRVRCPGCDEIRAGCISPIVGPLTVGPMSIVDFKNCKKFQSPPSLLLQSSCQFTNGLMLRANLRNTLYYVISLFSPVPRPYVKCMLILRNGHVAMSYVRVKSPHIPTPQE